MKRSLYLLVFLLLVTSGPVRAHEPAALAKDTKLQVFFSPDGGCTAAITNALGKARASVFVQAYSFTSATIAKSLVDAHRRGVKVSLILDKSQKPEKYSSATFLLNNGIPPLIDNNHAIAHNKVMVIDYEKRSSTTSHRSGGKMQRRAFVRYVESIERNFRSS